MKFGRKLRRMTSQAWQKEKQRAAVFLKLSEKFGSKHIVRQDMRRKWYRHIDKAIDGKTTSADKKHWKKMRKTFEREIVGEPSPETLQLFAWLQEFEQRVAKNEISLEDTAKWLPQFRVYMESCEKNAMDNYILKNKMLEA